MRWNSKNGAVPIDDTEMSYVSFGQGKKNLILLPGLSDGLMTVRGKAALLAKPYRAFFDKYTVYMFSRKDKLPEGCTIREMAADQARAMKTLGIKKHFVLVEKSPVKAAFLRNTLTHLQIDGEIFNDVINKTNFQMLAGKRKSMITSRAFKSVAEILAITPDFVEEMVLLKGEKWVEEIEEAQNKNLLGDWQFETAMSITGVGVVLWMYK